MCCRARGKEEHATGPEGSTAGDAGHGRQPEDDRPVPGNTHARADIRLVKIMLLFYNDDILTVAEAGRKKAGPEERGRLAQKEARTKNAGGSATQKKREHGHRAPTADKKSFCPSFFSR